MTKKRIHIIGTGTIGLPLVGLFTRHKKKFNLEEITFHKNTPLKHDISNVKQLLKTGAKLVTDKEKFQDFKNLGATPTYDRFQAIDNADVVIDCTPQGTALRHKDHYYLPKHVASLRKTEKERFYIAQGSEKGFGKIFAHDINNHALDKEDFFIQIASCNTHAGASLIKTCAQFGKHGKTDLVYIRRANDISQNSGLTPSIEVGEHADWTFGTHHARDVHDLFKTTGKFYNVYSSACKINSQLMHALRFDISVHTNQTLSNNVVLNTFKENNKIALTHHKTSNKIFSYGREFGYYGRILNQVVVPRHTLGIQHINQGVPEFSEGFNNTYNIRGFAYTPQDGNSLLSSVSAALWFLNDRDWDKVNVKLKCLEKYLFQTI